LDSFDLLQLLWSVKEFSLSKSEAPLVKNNASILHHEKFVAAYKMTILIELQFFLCQL